jgi:inosine/xanthosine triphosphate pyrophosphatase family protein
MSLSPPNTLKKNQVEEFLLVRIRASYFKNALREARGYVPQEEDNAFLAEDSHSTVDLLREFPGEYD